MVFGSETLVSSRRHNSELMVLGYGRLMQLFEGEVGRLLGLALQVRDGFPAYRQLSYECEYCEGIVVRNCSSSHNFYVFEVFRNLDLSEKNFLMVC